MFMSKNSYSTSTLKNKHRDWMAHLELAAHYRSFLSTRLRDDFAPFSHFLKSIRSAKDENENTLPADPSGETDEQSTQHEERPPVVCDEQGMKRFVALGKYLKLCSSEYNTQLQEDFKKEKVFWRSTVDDFVSIYKTLCTVARGGKYNGCCFEHTCAAVAYFVQKWPNLQVEYYEGTTENDNHYAFSITVGNDEYFLDPGRPIKNLLKVNDITEEQHNPDEKVEKKQDVEICCVTKHESTLKVRVFKGNKVFAVQVAVDFVRISEEDFYNKLKQYVIQRIKHDTNLKAKETVIVFGMNMPMSQNFELFNNSERELVEDVRTLFKLLDD